MFSKVNIISQDIDGCINLTKKSLPLQNVSDNVKKLLGNVGDLSSKDKEIIRDLSNYVNGMDIKSFYLNTGRDISNTLSIAHEFNKYIDIKKFRYIICETGSSIYDLKKSKEIDIVQLAYDNDLKYIGDVYKNEFEKMNQLGIWLDEKDGEKILNESLSNYFGLPYEKDNFFMVKLGHSFTVCFKEKKLTNNELIKSLKKLFKEKNIIDEDQICFYGSSLGVDISSYINKGMGLKVLLSSQGDFSKEVMHIGDDLNDISAMSYTGFASCPYNANNFIKTISMTKGRVAQNSYGLGTLELYKMIDADKK